MIDLSTLSEEELEQLHASLSDWGLKRALTLMEPGKTPARPLNPTPTPRPVKPDAQLLHELQERVKVLESAAASMRQQLWAEWQVVQDQVRSELRRRRDEDRDPPLNVVQEMLCGSCLRPIEKDVYGNFCHLGVTVTNHSAYPRLVAGPVSNGAAK